MFGIATPLGSICPLRKSASIGPQESTLLLYCPAAFQLRHIFRDPSATQRTRPCIRLTQMEADHVSRSSRPPFL
eukprot:scaffold45819_cov50-Prasinocladus_malaysianus.AAC.1